MYLLPCLLRIHCPKDTRDYDARLLMDELTIALAVGDECLLYFYNIKNENAYYKSNVKIKCSTAVRKVLFAGKGTNDGLVIWTEKDSVIHKLRLDQVPLHGSCQVEDIADNTRMKVPPLNQKVLVSSDRLILCSASQSHLNMISLMISDDMETRDLLFDALEYASLTSFDSIPCERLSEGLLYMLEAKYQFHWDTSRRLDLFGLSNGTIYGRIGANLILLGWIPGEPAQRVVAFECSEDGGKVNEITASGQRHGIFCFRAEGTSVDTSVRDKYDLVTKIDDLSLDVTGNLFVRSVYDSRRPSAKIRDDVRSMKRIGFTDEHFIVWTYDMSVIILRTSSLECEYSSALEASEVTSSTDPIDRLSLLEDSQEAGALNIVIESIRSTINGLASSTGPKGLVLENKFRLAEQTSDQDAHQSIHAVQINATQISTTAIIDSSQFQTQYAGVATSVSGYRAKLPVSAAESAVVMSSTLVKNTLTRIESRDN